MARRTNAEFEALLAECRAALTEARAQQAATAEVLRVMSASPAELQRVFEAICERAAALCGVQDAALARYEGGLTWIAATRGPAARAYVAEGLGGPGPPNPAAATGEAILRRATVHRPGIAERGAVARGMGAGVAVPLLAQGEPVGAIVVTRRTPGPFTDRQIAVLETFADQAVIALENARLFGELQDRLEEQTATAEVLRVISQSPPDLPRVFDAIAASAGRLCRAPAASIQRVVDGRAHVEAMHLGVGVPEAARARFETWIGQSGGPIADRTASGRALREYRTVHTPDMAAAVETDYPDSRPTQAATGYRTTLAVPLRRGDEGLGIIVLFRFQVEPFSDREIALAETFANQAVIAIENARLFGELQERTEQLTRSVERLTALFAVGQAVGGTLDLDRVLATVVERAVAISDTDSGTIWEFDPSEKGFHRRAGHNESAAVVAATLAHPPSYDGPGPPGVAARTRQPQHTADFDDRSDPEVARLIGEDSPLRQAVLADGLRSSLVVPLVADDRLLGLLAVRRQEPGRLPDDTVRLLQTFATQSALAIQNARLFQELAAKSAQLEDASRHKSEFLANMSHELRTPLNAIIGFTEVLLERYFGEVNEKQEDYLKDVLSSGQHLLALINDILDLSKVEAGRMELEVGTFDLGHALEAGLVMVKERASKKGIDLSLEVAEDTGRIEADERKLKQIVFNLLTNAVKFTPDGGKVSVSARRRDSCVEVAVADTGVGIAPDDLPRIFEEFGQARNQAGQTEGTGLGLALVKRYAELHGGSVRVESTIGRGSTFTLALPVTSVDVVAK